MPNVAAIARDPLALQFALTGVETFEVVTAEEAEEALDDLLASDVRLVVVEERLRNEFSTPFVRRLEKHKGLPLVLFCGEFDKEDDETGAYLAAVLKPAIGYEIRLDG
ncbi:MAG TPA: V-type ATP synthase subunit F [Candidatus Hydrogenedentes bacterium]|nr:V-type ATP synthase subunit F [Candidatus Hydrogenedentota bacterium]HPG66414.1 V-type ATP synthase subunit F [Candidatus Hydrogenedentota bacterium]